MNKNLYSLGLMSGTSLDGVDASIIQSDGEEHIKVIFDNILYTKYLCTTQVRVKENYQFMHFKRRIFKIIKRCTKIRKRNNIISCRFI